MARNRNRNKGAAPAPDPVVATAPASPTSPPPDPADEAERIIESLSDLRWGLERELDDAREAHELTGAQLLHAAGKAKRILSGHCRTAQELQDMLDETWDDSIIRTLMAKALNQPTFKQHGATDQQIADALWRTYKSQYNWPEFVRAEFGNNYGQKAGIIKAMSVTVGIKRHGSKPIAELKSLAVIAAARRLLKIPQPTKAAPPAKPAAAPAAKKPPPKKPAAKASPKPSPAGVAFRKQTFGQWMATARGALGVKKLDEADPRYTRAYHAGERPADAARRIKAEDNKSDPAPSPAQDEPSGVAAKLRASLHSHEGSAERWGRMQREGATDVYLKMQIAEAFGISGGSSAHGGHAHRGGKDPAFWDTHVGRGKPTLAGKALIDAVRKLLSIPQPLAMQPSPADPKPVYVNTPATVVLYFSSVTPLTLQAFARDMWLAGTIADKAASDRVRGADHAALPLIQKLGVEEKLEALAFEAGVGWIPVAPRPLAARRADAMAAAVDKPEPEPLEQRASAPVPIADVLPGVTARDLREAYSYETLTTGRVRRVFVDAARDCWVVMGMHLESDSYSLMPCVPIDRYPGPTESWHARRKQKLTPGQKPRFEGVTFAEQDTEKLYVFTSEQDQVNVIAKPAAAPAASRKAGAA